jgi:hypothetical protein
MADLLVGIVPKRSLAPAAMFHVKASEGPTYSKKGLRLRTGIGLVTSFVDFDGLVGSTQERGVDTPSPDAAAHVIAAARPH